MRAHVHDERGTDQIPKVSRRMDEPGAAVDLAHGKLEGTAAERVGACWERTMRGMRTQLIQLVPKFVSL
jgi:hypothetical protein